MTRIVKNPLERRKEIIEVARKFFLDSGYEKTTMNDVINKLGVAKGTVYHYFKSKEDLLDAVVDNMSDEYVEIVKKRLANKKKSAIKRFYELVKASNITDQSEETIKGLHQSGNIGLHVRLLALCIKKIAPLYAEIIQQGCKEGVFKTDYPLETAEVILAGVQFITDRGFYPWDKNDISRRGAALTSLIEAQLGAKKGTLKF